MNATIGNGVKADFDAVIVGAGFSGLYTLHKLRELGLNVRVFERGNGLGGTWFWNRYPGLQCDTETISYSFTFSPELYRGWTWSRRFAPQPEILDYANYVADRLDLRKDIQFETAVEHAHYDDADNVWRISLSDGSTVTATYFVTASGPLSTANLPRIAELDSFAGEVYHTAQWPERPVDFTGKRVAIIGTGSSGAQAICAIADKVDQLVVFQRTPQYVTPAQQRLISVEEMQDRKDNLDQLVEEMRNSSFGAPGTSTDRSAFEDTPEQREKVFEAAWEWGAQAFALATYKDLTTNEEANAMAADFVRGKISQIVQDPETARKLMPDYLFGTKRPIKVDGYYEAFNRENVHLVALREEPIVQATTGGLRTSEKEYEFDAIIFATGFDAITGTLFRMDIRGRDGIALRDKWDDGVNVKTLLGVGTSEFPNMFVVQGPQSPSVMANFLFGIQLNVDWITGLIGYLVKNEIAVCEVTREGEDAWSDHCQALAENTLLLKTESWWTGANIAEKPRPKYFQTYLGGVKEYADQTKRVADRGYPGFALTPRVSGRATDDLVTARL
ncbi:flavin-containing monooxygenase [Rhodococcus sp. NPDC003318]|uniref:flavin-containing monooxygenase n=1 Tax=Rhodococcus sp. NPDC003318 TaxID=3364503 RepID=UPI00368A831B